jgi:hypothetical protein
MIGSHKPPPATGVAVPSPMLIDQPRAPSRIPRKPIPSGSGAHAWFPLNACRSRLFLAGVPEPQAACRCRSASVSGARIELSLFRATSQRRTRNLRGKHPGRSSERWNHYGGRYCDKTMRIVLDHVRQMSFRTAEDLTLIYSKTAASPNLLGLSRHSHSMVPGGLLVTS